MHYVDAENRLRVDLTHHDATVASAALTAMIEGVLENEAAGRVRVDEPHGCLPADDTLRKLPVIVEWPTEPSEPRTDTRPAHALVGAIVGLLLASGALTVVRLRDAEHTIPAD